MPNDTIPLPEPWDYCYEWDGPFGTRKFSAASYNGNRPDRSVPIYTADQMRQYAAAVSAADNAALRAELAQAMKERARAIAVGDGMEQEVERLRAEVEQLRQYLDTAQRRASALGDEVAGLREALENADVAFESAEIFLPDGCGQEFGFYASWEVVRAALAARKGTT